METPTQTLLPASKTSLQSYYITRPPSVSLSSVLLSSAKKELEIRESPWCQRALLNSFEEKDQFSLNKKPCAGDIAAAPPTKVTEQLESSLKCLQSSMLSLSHEISMHNPGEGTGAGDDVQRGLTGGRLDTGCEESLPGGGGGSNTSAAMLPHLTALDSIQQLCMKSALQKDQLDKMAEPSLMEGLVPSVLMKTDTAQDPLDECSELRDLKKVDKLFGGESDLDSLPSQASNSLLTSESAISVSVNAGRRASLRQRTGSAVNTKNLGNPKKMPNVIEPEESASSDMETYSTCSSDGTELSEYKVSESEDSESEERDIKPNFSFKNPYRSADSPLCRNTDPARRMRGSRIYDSVLGETCHWCRQKTVEAHVHCSKCPIKFCGQCLLNRNGEFIQHEMQKEACWVCPKCRGGCGQGCINCCNCGPCRKEQNLDPTGQIIRVAKAAGFSNVHDYLVFEKTGESVDAIASRKDEKGWVNGDTPTWSGSKEELETGSGEMIEVDVPYAKAQRVVWPKQHLKRKGAECKVEKKRMRRVTKSICVPPPTTYQPIQVKQERAEKQPFKREPDELLEETETKDSKQLVDKLVIESVVKPRAGTASMSIRVKVEKLEEGGPQNSNIHYREGGIDICTIDRDGSVNAVTPSNGESKVSFRSSEVTSDTLHSVPGDLFDGEITQSSNSYSKRHRMEPHLEQKWNLPDGLQAEGYSEKLRLKLAEPFQPKQLADMWELANHRKPLLRLRQTRGRTVHVPTNDEGLSYLDHHPDLAKLLEDATEPEEKLRLLRGLFFWLQHSCVKGAYKPWTSTLQSYQGEDCIETNGPDCEILAVVLPLDEKKDVQTLLKGTCADSCNFSGENPVILLDDSDFGEATDVPLQKEQGTSTHGQNGLSEIKMEESETCSNCSKEFGMEIEQQPARYEACGHFKVCMSCAKTMWKLCNYSCPTCGLHQSREPRSMLEFTQFCEEDD
ncbi:unnamed protein product [Sphagnum troendelagicum]|uniref:RING-type domain-containing protein n=1 Tax=Sphagnum troendelagicum TaxID=128251 RepID=A0ABP0U2N5_9BRYO